MKPASIELGDCSIEDRGLKLSHEHRISVEQPALTDEEVDSRRAHFRADCPAEHRRQGGRSLFTRSVQENHTKWSDRTRAQLILPGALDRDSGGDREKS